MNNTPVILITYKRAWHTGQVLNALKEHNIKNLFIFSDGPKDNGDLSDVYETRLLFQRIEWTKPTIIEQDKNIGLANSIVSAVNYVFKKFDRVILLEDDCVPQKYFFDFIGTSLDKYENCEKVFGISGYTVPTPDPILKKYPHDLYFFPRIGSWGWATWKRAWQHFEPDLAKAYKKAVENNIDLSQGGTDIPLMLKEMLSGTLKDVWTLHWMLSVYLNKGCYIYPTLSHIENIGMDGSGVHCGATRKFITPMAERKPSRYPDDTKFDKDIYRNFRKYYDIQKPIPRTCKISSKTKSSLKIVQLCMQDFGGAGKAAYRLHKGLQTIGVDSIMLVLNKGSGDPSVKVLPNDYSKGMTNCLNVPVYNSPVWNQQAIRWQKLMLQYPNRPAGLEVFTDAVSDVRLDRVQEIHEADIINLHWVAGEMDWPNAHLAIGGKPIVWTLHDMNPFTGGCHYSGDCLNYKTSCGACPQLGSDTEKDLSNHVWKQKYDAYKDLSVNIVTPSRWLGKCAAESNLFSPFPVSIIPNGFPIDIFKPHPKLEIRKELNIPESAKVILFGAEAVVNARKGFAYLIEALNRLSSEDGHNRVILTFGSLPEGVKITSRYPVYNLGSVANENQLALAYSAADVFVIPSIEDNLPNTVIEAMACGVPVVGFDIGGIPDMVDHKKNGYLVKPKNIVGLIEGIDWVISSSDSGTNFSKRCREKVEKEYALEVQAKSYYELYKGIVKQHFPLVENTYSKVRTLNQQGEDLFSKGDLEGALDFFTKTLGIDPNSAIAHNNLGVLYYQRGSKEKALEHYRKAAEFQPENITFQKNLADFYYVELGRVEEAMQIYIKVLNANPEDIESLLILGHICVALKKFDDAKDFYARILIIEPWNKDAKQFFQKLEEYQLSVTGVRLGSEDIETASKEYLVSAIVSAYNSERFIRGCLEDLENQTIADRLEIVVVNSGSQENEEAIIKEFQEKYSNIKYIKTDKRETVYAAWNKGIKAATGKYITNANTDDRHRKDAFEVIINMIEQRPEIALVYADVIITETENETFENCTPVGYFSWMNWKREDLLNKGCFMGPQPMWRRDVHDEYGYFDDSLVTSGDYEFWLRISQTNTFLHLPLQLGLYLRSPGSIEHLNREKQREENNKIFEMYSKSDFSGKNIRRVETNLPQASVIKIDGRIESKLKALNPNTQVSIIISTSTQQKYIKNCVESIKKNTPQSHEIIFVNHGVTKGTGKWLKRNINENSNYQLVKCPKDAGSAVGVNEGIKASTGQYIFVLSNDIVVAKGWLSGMLDCMKRVPDAGIVGPMSNISRGLQTVAKADNVSIDQLDEFAESFMAGNRYRRISSIGLDGFCLLFRRDLVEEIGFFDEQFGQDGFENEDFCLRAILEGRKNLIAGDVYVHQQHRKTFNRSKKYFNAKWNKADTQSPIGKKYFALTAVEKGNESYQKGRIDNAVEKLLEGIGLSPNDKRTYYALAEILINAKKYKDASDVLNEMPPGEQDAKRLVLIGYCKEGMKLYDEAHDYANQALSLNPCLATALNLKGLLAYDQGDNLAAEDFFNRAIESDPGYGETYTNLGAIRWDKNQEEALNLFEKGCILSPTSPDIIANYYTAASALGEFERAGQIFKEAGLLHPNNKNIKYKFIDFLLKLEKHAQAISQIEEAIDLFGMDDGILSAALKIRELLGPKEIDKTKDKKSTVSLCMIVKNEEQHLTKCLRSVKPIVDEMIIVDTGSTDRTKDIAKVFGAKIYDYKWNDDFSEARNFSISKASGMWSLILDADEAISSLDHNKFKKIIEESKPVAYQLTTRNYSLLFNMIGWNANDEKYIDENAGVGWTPSDKVRLFPNKHGVRFEYPIHELIEPSLKKTGIEVKKCKIPIHHYGKLNQKKSDDKDEIYYQIGRKKLDEMGDNEVALCELAIQAETLGKHEESIELWERLIKIQPETALAFVNMGTAYAKLGKYEKAVSAASKALEIGPEMVEAHYNYAFAKVHIGQVKEAVLILEKLLSQFSEYPPAKFLLAVAYCLEARRAKWRESFKKLKISMGHGLAIACHEFAKGLVSAKRPDYAVTLLEAAIESKNSNKEINELYSKCLEMMNVNRKTGTSDFRF